MIGRIESDFSQAKLAARQAEKLVQTVLGRRRSLTPPRLASRCVNDFFYFTRQQRDRVRSASQRTFYPVWRAAHMPLAIAAVHKRCRVLPNDQSLKQKLSMLTHDSNSSPVGASSASSNRKPKTRCVSVPRRPFTSPQSSSI